MIGLAPDQNYYMSCFGTQRPATLDPKNTLGTYISTQMPDLFLAAQLAWLTGGFQRNWSPAADDPATAAGWQAEYKRLVTPALVEQMRMRLQAQGFGSRLPSPVASPAQT